MNTLFERNITEYKDEWLTPPALIKALGEFDLDPCSPINRPWSTAKQHYTIEDDGLTKEWFGRVWCNPPYSNVEQWLKKCAYHGDCIALTFARTETEYFFKNVWNKADAIFFIHKRLTFYNVEGTKAKQSAGAPSVLIAYGKENIQRILFSGLHGKLLMIPKIQSA